MFNVNENDKNDEEWKEAIAEVNEQCADNDFKRCLSC